MDKLKYLTVECKENFYSLCITNDKGKLSLKKNSYIEIGL